jgi:hypothetical protein
LLASAVSPISGFTDPEYACVGLTEAAVPEGDDGVGADAI